MADDLPKRCHDCLVRDTSLCASLCDSELAELGKLGRKVVVREGTVVSSEGDDNLLCATIVSGAIKLLKTTPDGREQAVGLLAEGDFVGQPFADSGALTAIAIRNTELCILPAILVRTGDGRPA